MAVFSTYNDLAYLILLQDLDAFRYFHNIVERTTVHGDGTIQPSLCADRRVECYGEFNLSAIEFEASKAVAVGLDSARSREFSGEVSRVEPVRDTRTAGPTWDADIEVEGLFGRNGILERVGKWIMGIDSDLHVVLFVFFVKHKCVDRVGTEKCVDERHVVVSLDERVGDELGERLRVVDSTARLAIKVSHSRSRIVRLS